MERVSSVDITTAYIFITDVETHNQLTSLTSLAYWFVWGRNRHHVCTQTDSVCLSSNPQCETPHANPRTSTSTTGTLGRQNTPPIFFISGCCVCEHVFVSELGCFFRRVITHNINQTECVCLYQKYTGKVYKEGVKRVRNVYYSYLYYSCFFVLQIAKTL